MELRFPLVSNYTITCLIKPTNTSPHCATPSDRITNIRSLEIGSLIKIFPVGNVGMKYKFHC